MTHELFCVWLAEAAIYCTLPGHIENGQILLVEDLDNFDHRPYIHQIPDKRTIKYQCDRGYELVDGPATATCMTGQWIPNPIARYASNNYY